MMYAPPTTMITSSAHRTALMTHRLELALAAGTGGVSTPASSSACSTSASAPSRKVSSSLSTDSSSGSNPSSSRPRSSSRMYPSRRETSVTTAGWRTRSSSSRWNRPGSKSISFTSRRNTSPAPSGPQRIWAGNQPRPSYHSNRSTRSALISRGPSSPGLAMIHHSRRTGSQSRDGASQ